MGSPEVRGARAAWTAGVPVEVELEYAFIEHAQLRGVAVGAAATGARRRDRARGRGRRGRRRRVVVVGTNADWETEGEDRSTMALPGRQDELIARVAAVNPRTVVVINAGSPVAMPWIDDVAAVLQIWFPGEEIGNALADVLLGVRGARRPAADDDPATARGHAGAPARTPARTATTGTRRGSSSGTAGTTHATSTRCSRSVTGSATPTGASAPRPSTASIEDGITVRVPVDNVGSRDGSTVVQVYVGPQRRRRWAAPTAARAPRLPQGPPRSGSSGRGDDRAAAARVRHVVDRTAGLGACPRGRARDLGRHVLASAAGRGDAGATDRACRCDDGRRRR